MAQEIATAYISLVPSMRGFNTTVSKELQGLDGPASTAGESLGSKFMAGVGKTVKITAGAVGGVLATALVKGFQRLSSIENATAKLKGLGNSAEDVSSIMSNALAAVKGTAFGMDEAATIAAGAVAAGIKPGRELERTLKLTGDAATIAGVGLGEMGAIFNKVATSNKIQGDVIAQLNDAGIPIVQLLGKELGKTSDEVLALSKTGEISFENFQNAMEKGLGGAALKSGNTTTGAFKNMNAALSRFGAALLKDIFPIIGPVFNRITEGLDVATAKVGPFIKGLMLIGDTDVLGPEVVAKMGLDPNGAFGKGVAAIIEGARNLWAGLTMDQGVRAEFSGQLEGLVAVGAGVRAAFDEMVGGFRAFGEAWKANNGDVTSSGFPGFMEELANKFRAVQASLARLDFSSFQGFLTSLVGQGGPVSTLLGGIGDALPKLGGAVSKIVGAGFDALAGVLGFMADHMDVIIPLIPVVVAGFLAWHAATGALAWQTHALQAAQLAMTPVLIVNNALRVTAALLEGHNARALAASTAATVAQTGATNGMTIAQRASAVAQRVLNAAMRANPIGIIITAVVALVGAIIWFFTQTELGQQIWGGFIGWLTDLWNGFASWLPGLWDGIVSAVTGAWEALTSWITGAGAAFTGWWNGLWGAVGQFLADAWNGLVTVVTTAWNAVVAWVTGAVTGFLGWWDGVWSGIMSVVQGYWTIITTVFSTAWEIIQTLVATALAVLIYMFQGRWDEIGGLFVSAWNKISGFIGAAWTVIWGIISGWLAAIGAFLAAAWAGIVNLAVGAWNGLVAFLAAVWDGIVATATAVWNGMIGIFTGAWDSIIRTVVSFGAGIVKFLSDTWSNVTTGVSNAWNGIVDWIKGIPDRIVQGLQDLGRLYLKFAIWIMGVRDAAVEKFNLLIDWVKGVPQMILDGLGNLGNLLINAGGQIMDGFKKGLEGAFGGVKDFIGGIGDWIAEHKGPKSYDLRLLVPNGGWVMQSLATGLRGGMRYVDSVLGWVTDRIGATQLAFDGGGWLERTAAPQLAARSVPARLLGGPASGPLEGLARLGAGSPGAGQRPVEITVNAAEDPYATAVAVGRHFLAKAT